MAFFEWKADYSVDVASIDLQHKKLVGMLNDLYEAMKSGKASGPVVKKTIDDLLAYTRTHFSFEEQLLKKHGYPEYDAHVQKHVAMFNRVNEFSTKISQGASQPVLELATFLKDWLQKHILGTDKQYGPFLKSKGAQ